MKNISVFIEGESKTVTFQNPVETYASILTVKETTVFWKFKNITSDLDNGKFTVIVDDADPTKDVEKSITEGYYDFQQLKDRLEGEKLELTMNVHNNTCTINNKTGSKVNLKKFGELLGFPENYELPSGSEPSPTPTPSPKPVDVNHGLRYLIVECDFVDPAKNTWNCRPSEILAFLPITPGTRLNSNCYVYEGNNAHRRAKNDFVSKMKFTVKSNVSGLKVDTDILMDITLE